MFCWLSVVRDWDWAIVFYCDVDMVARSFSHTSRDVPWAVKGLGFALIFSKDLKLPIEILTAVGYKIDSEHLSCLTTLTLSCAFWKSNLFLSFWGETRTLLSIFSGKNFFLRRSRLCRSLSVTYPSKRFPFFLTSKFWMDKNCFKLPFTCFSKVLFIFSRTWWLPA